MLGNVALAARLVPAIGGLRVMRTWAGMNTTVDGKSVLGPVPGGARRDRGRAGRCGLYARAAGRAGGGGNWRWDLPPCDPTPLPYCPLAAYRLSAWEMLDGRIQQPGQDAASHLGRRTSAPSARPR